MADCCIRRWTIACLALALALRMDVLALDPNALPIECPPNWYKWQNSCYAAFEGPATWHEAKDSCELKGASLTSIHSQAENDHAVFACGNTRPFHQGCWIGGTDKKKRNVWLWVDGSKWDWSRWYDHGGGNKEPNNDFCSNHRQCTYGSTADCNTLEVSGGKQGFKSFWLDAFCTDKQKYICKLNSAGADDEATSAQPIVTTAPPVTTTSTTTTSELPPATSPTTLPPVSENDTESDGGGGDQRRLAAATQSAAARQTTAGPPAAPPPQRMQAPPPPIPPPEMKKASPTTLPPPGAAAATPAAPPSPPPEVQATTTLLPAAAPAPPPAPPAPPLETITDSVDVQASKQASRSDGPSAVAESSSSSSHDAGGPNAALGSDAGGDADLEKLDEMYQ